jgi:trimeric autotransporter adhesin
VQVNADTAEFSLAASPASQTISPGQTTSYTATLTPLNGFNQAVTLACSGAPATTMCALANGSVTLNGTSNTTDQVNVNTTAGSMAFRSGVTTGRRLLAFSVALLPLLCGFAAGWLRRRALSRAYFLALVACGLFLALCMTACGSGGSHSTSTNTQTGTPAGTYTLTITGTSGR